MAHKDWVEKPAAGANDFWRDVTASQALPDGANDTTEGIAHDGSVKIGGATAGPTVAPLPAGTINNYEWLEATPTERTQVMRGTAPRDYYTTRALPVAVNGYVELGSFVVTSGAHNHRIAVTVSDSGFSVAKQYTVSTQFGQTGAGVWRIVAPCEDSGPYVGQDFELLANVVNTVITYRLRRSRGTVAGTAHVTIESIGRYDEVFTELAGTGTDATVLNMLNGCPLPMTRAALLALRASSLLSMGCHYTITDHVQGRLVAGTTITLHAVASNELAETALINTTYDNEGWSGRYDIDTGLVVELTDNRNNRVVGFGSVSAFDWGNTAYSDCTVEHSTWTVTIGSPRPMQRVRLLDGSNLNTSGMTGGQLTNVEISKQSSVNLSNGNLTLQNSTITDQSTLTATGYVAGSTGVIRTRIAEFSSVTFGAGSGAVSVQNCVVSSGASINHTGAGSFTLNGSTISDNASVAHTGLGVLFAAGCFVHGTATQIAHSDGGSLSMTGSEIGPYGRVLKNGASTGTLTLNYCQIDTVGYVQQLGNGNISMTGAKISQSGYVRTLAGSAVPTLTVNYSTVSETSSISMNATATAGLATINNSSLDSGGFIDKSGTGDLTVTGSKVTATGRIQLNGVRSLIVSGSLCSNVGRVVADATAGAGVTDTFQNSSAQDYAIVQFSASGAAPNRVLYSSVRGLAGALTFSGTNTGTDVTRFTIDNGVVTFANNTVAFPTILDNAVRDGGTMAVSGCGAAQDIRYNTIQSGGRINLTNKTAAGPRQCFRNTVESLGTLTSQGAAGHVSENYVRQGVVNHNGGNLTSSSKTQGGTLTTGAFTHTNIQHHAAVSKTLTANNTNRADYQGLAAQLV